MAAVLEDILNSELLDSEPRIVVQRIYEFLSNRAAGDRGQQGAPRSTTLGKAKTLLEFYDLVGQAVRDYEIRASVPDQLKVKFTEEEPDAESETETITYGLIKRVPGGFGQGAPFETNVKNLRPIFRDSVEDTENPGYRKLTTGYWHEHLVRFTCWARTNKAANLRAMWFESLMEDYTWWFVLQGLSRVIYMGQSTDLVITVGNNRWYGRPIDYYVKTESLKVFSEKTLEEIIMKLALGK